MLQQKIEALLRNKVLKVSARVATLRSRLRLRSRAALWLCVFSASDSQCRAVHVSRLTCHVSRLPSHTFQFPFPISHFPFRISHTNRNRSLGGVCRCQSVAVGRSPRLHRPHLPRLTNREILEKGHLHGLAAVSRHQTAAPVGLHFSMYLQFTNK
ncbi:uncharacterized protein LOC143909167 [Arctopsyche grandis]|uniref:uncharacterized protein LOC143909167 n=1 Tax=Arctopsyche grandis TaxID=121162 RepID=UPI00406D922A